MNTWGNSVGSLALSSKENLGGIAYSRNTIDQLHASICSWLRGSRLTSATLSYVNPHVFNLAKKNEKLRALLARADIVAVDGLGFALAVLLFKRKYQSRTVMTPLFDRVLAAQDIPNLKAILIGSTEPIATKAAAAMNQAGSRIRIVRVCDGYQSIEHYITFLKDQADVDLVLVAMGTPRAEELLLAAAQSLEPRLYWNIGGGTLHFYAGTQARVPRFVSAVGMQWLWRILHQPTIAPRYLLGIPLYLIYLAQLSIPKRKVSITNYENPHRQSCLQNPDRT